MRKIFLLIAIIFLVGCNSPKHKADKLVETYLKENLKDPSSYECINKGNLAVYTPMIVAVEEETERTIKGEASSDTMDVFLDHVRKYFKQSGINPYDTLAWELPIKYRAKNSFGGFDVNDCVFYFDKNITKIINVKSK